MKSLDRFPFKTRVSKKSPPPSTCVVIVCSINSGLVRRKQFSSWSEAEEYAQKWRDKNSAGRAYEVSIERTN